MAGLGKYTVVEAQNAALGQVGSVWLDTNSTTFTPSNGVVIAITMVTDCSFDTLTGAGGTCWINRVTDGYEDQGDSLAAADVFPAGLTIYGRWSQVSVANNAEQCICYVG